VVDKVGTFAVATSAAADGMVVTLAGEMDLTAAEPFGASVLPWLDGFRAEQVTVDCAGLTFVALAGLDLLLEAAVRCRPGGRIGLVDAPASLVRLLDFTGGRGLFTLLDARDGAVASV
jgi:anti-anti-sigma factor